MLKSELIDRLAAAYPHLKVADAERVVNIILKQVTNSLTSGGRVELRGFGTFSVRKRATRRGRNPQTGEAVEVPPKTVPFFKSGKDLKDRLQK